MNDQAIKAFMEYDAATRDGDDDLRLVAMMEAQGLEAKYPRQLEEYRYAYRMRMAKVAYSSFVVDSQSKRDDLIEESLLKTNELAIRLRKKLEMSGISDITIDKKIKQQNDNHANLCIMFEAEHVMRCVKRQSRIVDDQESIRKHYEIMMKLYK